MTPQNVVLGIKWRLKDNSSKPLTLDITEHRTSPARHSVPGVTDNRVRCATPVLRRAAGDECSTSCLVLCVVNIPEYIVQLSSADNKDVLHVPRSQ
ncbi:Secreted protein [Operophtera brumata]|uniref:Secreted protein n=1 Tax=Operophtera brumata TaxID=104452 RepID=A0A0L7KW77_OPEBR|nr:Secreted protein [Operophtera brumata]